MFCTGKSAAAQQICWWPRTVVFVRMCCMTQCCSGFQINILLRKLKSLPKWAYFALCFIFAWCACTIVPSLIEWTDFPHHTCRRITCFALPYSACTAVAHMRFHLPGDEFQFRHQTQQSIFFNRPLDHLTNHLLLPLTFYFPFDLSDQQVEE